MSDPAPAIVALGEPLVEVMRPAGGAPLGEPGAFRGPFASGAPAIFAAAAGRLGARVRFAGVRGDDPFGALVERELARAGVDTRGLRTGAGTTGTAFVGYREGGERDFVFHLAESAAARLGPDDLDDALFEEVGWLHLTGSSLAVSESVRRACLRAARRAREAGATVSFDPNLRTELLAPGAAEALCAPALELAQVVLPSGPEASALAGEDDPSAACRALLARGAELVLHKLGPEGCDVHHAAGTNRATAPSVEEVDPTGAGDCFAAGFAVARLGGAEPVAAARFACAVGALSVTAFGPMEGAPTRAEVEAALAR